MGHTMFVNGRERILMILKGIDNWEEGLRKREWKH